MGWTLKRLKDTLNEISRGYGDTFDIEVAINGRLTKTHGRVLSQITNGVCTPLKLEMSKQLLETGTDEGIIDIIKHEWAHYYLDKTTKVAHGHDKVFKALCAELGCTGAATGSVERKEEVKDKYHLVCNCCGKKVAGYTRKCKTLTAAESGFVTSKCCGSKVTVVQNW